MTTEAFQATIDIANDAMSKAYEYGYRRALSDALQICLNQINALSKTEEILAIQRCGGAINALDVRAAVQAWRFIQGTTALPNPERVD